MVAPSAWPQRPSLIARGLPVRLYESGASVAANVREWGHVRLFSPWGFDTDKAATSILRRHGWQAPPNDMLPTGDDLVAAYLEPLVANARDAERHRDQRKGPACLAAGHRQGRDAWSRGPSVCADDRTREGRAIDLARAVIDASGTWQNPSPLGASGTPAIGEAASRHRIAYGIPDVLRAERATYAGKRVLVIGGGHSAANALLDLARLAETDAGLRTHLGGT